MFERYTEKARRVIFFARYESSQFGGPYIETEHLLLGLLREDKELTHRFLRGEGNIEAIRKQIEDATEIREKTSTSVDLPLSNEGKRALVYAAEESEKLGHKHIGTEHLLLGLLREEKSFAAQLLHERGVRLSSVREELALDRPEPEPVRAGKEIALLADFCTYLTKLARENRLLPLIGREKELEQVFHVLGRSAKNNVVLVGEPGVGKRAIAEGLVQRVAGKMAPEFMEGKLFVGVDLATIVTAAQHSSRPKEFLAALAPEFTSAENTIFVFEDLHVLLGAGKGGGAHELNLLLKPGLLSGKVRCIALATPEEYRNARKKARWLERCFLPVELGPATEAQALAVLQGAKERFEKFHSVQYTEDALRAAVVYSHRHIKDRNLPDKAIDLIDDAGAYLKLKLEKAVLPEEVIEVKKRLTFVTKRWEMAVANHEYEKARFYSDEQRAQKEALRELEKKHNIQHDYVGTVTEQHIAEALSRWTGLSLAAVRAGAEPGEMKSERPAGARKKSRRKSA